MGALTADRPKCMVEIVDKTAAIDVQLRAIMKQGSHEIVITTGPFAEVLQRHVAANYPSAKVTWVNNAQYATSNYIYSIELAKKHLEDDIVMMHGDLVFEQSVYDDIIQSQSSVMVVDSMLPLPEKDFKARIEGGKISAVGIEFFEQALAAQPLYKLNKADWIIWLERISDFCEKGNRSVYAENAFNEVSAQMNLVPLDVCGRVCGEIDTEEDLHTMRKTGIKELQP